MSSIQKNVLKKKILELIKEDEEFRLAIIGALTESFVTKEEIKELLKEIRNLAKQFNKRMESFEKRMEEMREDFNKRMESFEKRMEEMREDFNKRMESFEKRMEGFDLKLSAIGARWGIFTEESIRKAFRGILEEKFGAKVEKWEVYDEKGIVYGHPSIIDVDVLIKDSEHILIEIKSHVRKSDVAELLRVGELYREKTGIKPSLALVTPFIDENAKEFARSKNINVYTPSDLGY